jgi:hypothetical protein
MHSVQKLDWADMDIWKYECEKQLTRARQCREQLVVVCSIRPPVSLEIFVPHDCARYHLDVCAQCCPESSHVHQLF